MLRYAAANTGHSRMATFVAHKGIAWSTRCQRQPRTDCESGSTGCQRLRTLPLVQLLETCAGLRDSPRRSVDESAGVGHVVAGSWLMTADGASTHRSMRPVSGVVAMSIRYTWATEPSLRVKSRGLNHCDSR
jgi:hypothetical protein